MTQLSGAVCTQTAAAEDRAPRKTLSPDEFDESWDLSGAVQLSNIVLDFARQLANSSGWPSWSPDAEFKRVEARPAM